MKARYYLGLGFLLAVCLIGGTLLIANQAADARQSQIIAGCERTNSLRQGAYNNFISDAESREVAAAQFTGEAKRALLALAQRNRLDAANLVGAASEFPKKPGSPQVDCEAAFK